MALIHPNVFDAVVAIGKPGPDNTKRWVGTGFLFGQFIETTAQGQKKYRVFLVSNKHVFGSLNQMFLRFNPRQQEKAIDLPITLQNEPGKFKWKGHSDPKIDLAVLELNMKAIGEQGAKTFFIRSDEHALTLPQMQENGISEGDGVFALGYPMGILDEDKQYVILRSGSIARIRDSYDGHKQDFLCDVFVFPGNSGGPVFAKPDAVSVHGTVQNKKSALIGVVRSYIPYRDTAVSQQTRRPRITFEENSGLASIIPIDHLLELLETL
ncbi:MAG: trypsin-like peptidase domain-containing protein [Flavobacteriales bacterium]|nr:trypsin-like peptidase domain-containing protein [Flavobacteriales bacterium]